MPKSNMLNLKMHYSSAVN